MNQSSLHRDSDSTVIAKSFSSQTTPSPDDAPCIVNSVVWRARQTPCFPTSARQRFLVLNNKCYSRYRDCRLFFRPSVVWNKGVSTFCMIRKRSERSASADHWRRWKTLSLLSTINGIELSKRVSLQKQVTCICVTGERKSPTKTWKMGARWRGIPQLSSAEMNLHRLCCVTEANHDSYVVLKARFPRGLLIVDSTENGWA